MTGDHQHSVKSGTSNVPRVAIQGISTSFHDVAARTFFGNNILPVECLSFDLLSKKLLGGEADFAVMAIENSIAGSILQNYFLLQANHFSVIGELYLPIHLHLLALPGVKIEDIRVVESHPMALRQCTDYLSSLSVEIRESEDTAFSAKRVSTLRLTNTAAVANESAARQFGLEILKQRIETNRKNFTRFLILAPKGSIVEKSNKASLCFEVMNEVGSLADALITFKAHEINLSKIQSIPIIGKPQEYSIHVDVEWTRRDDYDEAIKHIMRQVKNFSILGEYVKGKIEQTQL